MDGTYLSSYYLGMFYQDIINTSDSFENGNFVEFDSNVWESTAIDKKYKID